VSKPPPAKSANARRAREAGECSLVNAGTSAQLTEFTFNETSRLGEVAMNRVLLVIAYALVLSAIPASAQQQSPPGASKSGSMKKVDPPTNPSPRAPANQGATTGTTMGPAPDLREKSGSYSRPPEAPEQPQPPTPRR
jgi:hypothetical protein